MLWTIVVFFGATVLFGLIASFTADESAGVRIEDFVLQNVPERVARLGDLWKPMLATRRRFDLGKFL